MKLELADTAYMKDQQIEILKQALLSAKISTEGDPHISRKSLAEYNYLIDLAVDKAAAIETKWREEVA